MEGYIKKFENAHSENDKKKKMYAYFSHDLRRSNSISCSNASESESKVAM